MKQIAYIIGAVVVIAAAYYLISPLFIQTELSEAVPEFNQISSPEEVSSTSGGVSLESEATAGPQTDGPFAVVGTAGHEARGSAFLISQGDERVLRYEEYYTINGPNLHVYLATDLEASEYVDLGPLKATSGNINYDIPEGVDLSTYRYALVWCVPFGVLFNSAELAL